MSTGGSGEAARRGRHARRPGAIPVRGWGDIAWRVLVGFQIDSLAMVARSVAFSGVMALFPSLAALVALYGLVADAQAVSGLLALLGGLVPPDALRLLADEMIRIAAATDATLSFTFVISLLAALWTANTGMRALFRGLNIAYGEREGRGLLRLNLETLAWSAGGYVFLLITTGLLVLAPLGLQGLGFDLGEAGWMGFRWPLLWGVVTVGLCALYRWGPSRTPAQWRWLWIGAAAAGVLWLGGSALLTWWLGAFGGFAATYGSLAAIFGVLTWSWLSAVIVLLGAKISAEIEHQTQIDTTVGAPKPLGARGARMADTVGARARLASLLARRNRR